MIRIILTSILILNIPFIGWCKDQENINIASMPISERAKALLKNEQTNWCNPIEEGENIFSFDSHPVTSIVLGMDGEVAEFIEYSKFTCKVGYGRNGGGSGGYPLVVVIEDVIYDLDLVRSGWKVVNLGWDSPVLLVSRHGSFCNRSGTYACLQAFVYQDKVLSTPTDWLCTVKDEVSCGMNPMEGVEILKVEIE